MSRTFPAPLRFEPIFVEKIWGGSALRGKLGKDAPEGLQIGESWEVSGWGGSQTAVSGGSYAGATLGELFALDPKGLAGAAGRSKKNFPLLFKFIDAEKDLSIQVHPNSEQARAHGWGDCGKTEAWYVVDAEEGARIALGFNKSGVSREEAEAAIAEGRFESLLNFVPAKRGDAFFIPAGTVHAILGGVLIYEVQEESNTTLRLYDWNRVCENGGKRELHVADALDIINFNESRPLKPEPVTICENGAFAHESLCSNSKFILSRYRFSEPGEAALDTIDGFRVISVTAGGAAVRAGGSRAPLALGQTILVPSLLGDVAIEGSAGTDVLVTVK
jgi:mannose-6-phosphate isomerase